MNQKNPYSAAVRLFFLSSHLNSWRWYQKGSAEVLSTNSGSLVEHRVQHVRLETGTFRFTGLHSRDEEQVDDQRSRGE